MTHTSTTHTPTTADIERSHLIDDYEKVRTGGLRHATRASLLLDDALHAVRHGRTDAALDLMLRALGHVDEARTTLSETPGRLTN